MSCVFGEAIYEECPVINCILDSEEKFDFNALGRFCQACPSLKEYMIKLSSEREGMGDLTIWSPRTGGFMRLPGPTRE